MQSGTKRPKVEKLQAASSVVRDRIVHEAFAIFMERGFARASMLEIATRARVSKRDLYAHVGNKQKILVAGIAARANRMRPPDDMPVPRDRASLCDALSKLGSRLLREATDRNVIGVFRLAIAEAECTPEVAHAIHTLVREQNRSALWALLQKAVSQGLLEGNTDEMTEQFLALLWGSLLINLLLGVATRPSSGELQQRAHAAALALLRLHSPPRADER
jgi:AcrR family transcriptional regulator